MMPRVRDVISSADPFSAQCAGMLVPSICGTQTRTFALPSGLVAEITFPVMFEPPPAVILIATPPPANCSPDTEFATTFFIPEEITSAYELFRRLFELY